MFVNDAVGFYVSRRNNDQVSNECVGFVTIFRRGRFCSFQYLLNVIGSNLQAIIDEED